MRCETLPALSLPIPFGTWCDPVHGQKQQFIRSNQSKQRLNGGQNSIENFRLHIARFVVCADLIIRHHIMNQEIQIDVEIIILRQLILGADNGKNEMN